VGGEKEEKLLLQFRSTVVKEDFPEGEKVAGKELRERLQESLRKYRRRLKEVHGEDYAQREVDRLEETLGRDCSGIAPEKGYEILSSTEHLCYCELPPRDKFSFRPKQA
jgi:predicted DNA-binding antitoxin AbrB/MazE fold protein